MKQLELDEMDVGVLPDGTEISVGDIILYRVAMHVGITRVILFGGKLCMEGNFMYGDNTSIGHFLSNASYNTVEKMSLVDLYKFCKKNNWETGYYIKKFGKNNK